MRNGMKQSSVAAAQSEADAWNDSHPIGTPVLYWTWVREGEGRTGETRSNAWDHYGTAVVCCTGGGWVALSHVEPTREGVKL